MNHPYEPFGAITLKLHEAGWIFLEGEMPVIVTLFFLEFIWEFCA